MDSDKSKNLQVGGALERAYDQAVAAGEVEEIERLDAISIERRSQARKPASAGEIDFSKGQRGKFFREGARLVPPAGNASKTRD